MPVDMIGGIPTTCVTRGVGGNRLPIKPPKNPPAAVTVFVLKNKKNLNLIFNIRIYENVIK